MTFGSSSTTATVTVAQTLTFTNDTLSLTFVVDPTGPASGSTKAVTLTVQTNASTRLHAGCLGQRPLPDQPGLHHPRRHLGTRHRSQYLPGQRVRLFGHPHDRRHRRRRPGFRAHGRQVRRLSVLGGHLPQRHRPDRRHRRHVGADRPGRSRLLGACRDLHRHHHLRGDADLLDIAVPLQLTVPTPSSLLITPCSVAKP